MLGGFVQSFVISCVLFGMEKFLPNQKLFRWQFYLLLFINLLAGLSAWQDLNGIHYLWVAFNYFFLIMLLIAKIKEENKDLLMEPLALSVKFILEIWGFSSLLMYVQLNTKQLEKFSEIVSSVYNYGAFTAFLIAVFSWKFKEYVFQKHNKRLSFKKPFLTAIAFILSFGLKYFIDLQLVRLIQLIIIVYWLLQIIRVFPLPKEKAKSMLMVLLGLLGLFFGFIGMISWKWGIVHVQHSIYVLGFIWLSVFIVLIHINPVKIKVEKSKLLNWTFWIIVIAAITRVSSPIIPRLYNSHLGYSALTLIFGLILSVIYILKNRKG